MQYSPSSFPLRILRALCGSILLASLTGCASYTNETTSLRSAWDAGNLGQAAVIAQDKAKTEAKSQEALLWDLEAGATTRAAADLNASVTEFNLADALFDYWEQQPEISVSREALATMVNQTVLPYRGTAYDRIMESTYQALNYLQLGQYDKARVELNRSLDRQREAVAANADRIQKAQQAAAESSAASHQGSSSGQANGNAYDVQRAQGDPKFQGEIGQNYSDLDSLRFYAPYVNPFSVYLEGIYFLARGEGLSDFERARVDLNRVREMIGDNPYIAADYALAEQLASGRGQMTPTTYVIFETGVAPIRQEVRIDIPLFLVSRSVPYVGVAFPRLLFNNQFNPGLTVSTTAATPVHTALLCNMDLVIAQEFKNELPVLITKTLVSAGAKAAAQYGVYAATKNNDLLSSLFEVAGTVYQYATNRADLRTWSTLPKEFVFARLPTPPDRQIQIRADASSETLIVDLPPGVVTIVYVKNNIFVNHLEAHAFTLR